MSSGEFDAQHKHEEEKAQHSTVNVNEDGVHDIGGKEKVAAPPTELLVLDDNDEEEVDNYRVHPPPGGGRPRHYPPPSSVQAPKPLSKSPVVTGELNDHLKKKKSSLLFSPSTKSSMKGPSSGSIPTISSSQSQKAAPKNNQQGFHHDDEQTNESHQQQSATAASLVVCGVDGTVYTLDAYTGQLRGLFASGPALVFSSSPEDDHADKENDVHDASVDSTNGHDYDDTMNDHLQGDTSNALTSNVSPGWKERVVPGLDGRLYSLFEMDASADDPDFEECKAAYDDGEYDDLDDICATKIFGGEGSSSGDSDGIVPRYSYNLTPLPISAMDVVDSPISTCRPNGDAQQEQCGIIVGSKKTTIYAIDPKTGKVRWTQDPQGAAGGRGFTTRPPKTSRGRSVLLQREDYAVRHLDTDGGEEVWKVELGRFSALDFDADSSNRGGRGSPGRESGSDDDDDLFGGDNHAGSDHTVGGRRRGAAATAAAVDSKDKKKKSSVPPILGGKKKPSLHDFDFGSGDDHHHTGGRKESLFEFDEDEFDHDHSAHFRAFPSIAFGEDGTSIMAVDGISGELLWRRRIESVVAAVYGVGKESIWVPLDVIDESEVFTHGHSTAPQHNGQKTGLLPLSSPSSGGLVPYGAGQTASGHRLGRHHSSLFVSSKYDAHPLAEIGVDSLPYAANLDTPLPPEVVSSLGNHFRPTDDRFFAMHPSEIPMSDVNPPQSHRTEHGLYLSWSMIAAIVMVLLSIVVFVARVIILRQKRKWEHTPSLDPTTAPSLSEDGRERSQSSAGILLPPPAQNLTAPSSGNILTKKQLFATRSYSLDALGSHSMGSTVSNVARPFISEKNGATLPVLDLSAPAAPQPSLGNESPHPSVVATTASPRMTRSTTLPTEEIPSEDKASQGVDNIDGIPLVRYSRYRSEFKETLPLGRGGFGTVFQCKNALDGGEYAIKKIKIISQLSDDGKVTKHFSQKLHRVLREVKCLALLDHPNIVRYYTAWLEVDDGNQNEDDETNTTSSIFDRKSHGIFSSSLFSGFGSNSRAMQTSFTPKRAINQKPSKGFLRSYNPLGWNNFGSSFRLDETKSEASSSFGAEHADAQNVALCEEEDDDLGFNWERSNETTVEASENAEKQPTKKSQEETLNEEDSDSSSSGISSVDSEESRDEKTKASTSKSVTQSNGNAKKVKLPEPATNGTECEKHTTEVRHMLFIQMQLCSVSTLADFLANREARRGSVLQSSSQNSSYAVDIPFALRLFSQIANGVKYVHKQGLIHRDLKPQNCFIDDAGYVKVGDFGLSRESSTAAAITDFDENGEDDLGNDDSFSPPDISDAENTAGVGTRAYASPEQMRGSNYDASTDVFSLGLLLFELCYPMYTNMERYTEFSGIQKGRFPTYWKSHVKTSFPTMHDLLVQMISDSPSHRPSVDAVSDHIDSLLREYSVQSLDKSWGKKGALLLRVEAEEKEGVLAHAMKLIKDAAPHSTILQYGLRGQASQAIMEFALQIEDNEKKTSLEIISSLLQDHDMTARRISNK